MKLTLQIIAGTILFLAVMFGLKSLNMISYDFFGTWKEEIRYDIQKESQAYRDGMQRNLSDLKFQYDKADSYGRIGIRETVRHQYAQTNTSEYPPYLQSFLAQMGL
jgi:GH18 family chitinase